MCMYMCVCVCFASLLFCCQTWRSPYCSRSYICRFSCENLSLSASSSSATSTMEKNWAAAFVNPRRSSAQKVASSHDHSVQCASIPRISFVSHLSIGGGGIPNEKVQMLSSRSLVQNLQPQQSVS